MLESLKERDSYQLNRYSCLSVADLECTSNPTLEFIEINMSRTMLENELYHLHATV